MNFGLLWIDAFIASVLWVAAAAAFVGRIRRRWIRRVFFPVVVGPPVLVLGAFVCGSAAMKFSFGIERNWFTYFASLLIAWLCAAAIICYRGRSAAAAHWPRGPLLLAWLAAMVIGYMTLSNMDLTMRARCEMLEMKCSMLYVALSPAIISDSQNAAILYEQAYQRFKDDGHELDIKNPPTGNNVDDDFDPNEPATTGFLARQAGTLQLLRQAAAMPGCRFDRDLEDREFDFDLLHLNEASNAANVLALDARVQIAHGNAAAALADVDAIFKMSRHIGRRPLLISSIVGTGIDQRGVTTLQRVLPTITKPADLNELHLESLAPFGRSFQQALWGEERDVLGLYRNLPKGSLSPQAGSLINPDLLMHNGISDAFVRVFFMDPNAYLVLMQNLQDLAIQPYYQIKSRLLNAGSAHYFDTIMSIIAPSLTHSFTNAGRVDTGDALAKTALAMTRYRLDHGSLPSKLESLIPAYLDAIPTDPFDGHPLRLVLRDGKWIIYSVGPEGVDHGGVEKIMNRDKGDITFTMPASK